MRPAFSNLRSAAEISVDAACGSRRTRPDERPAAPVEAALADAERTGFRLAIIGRTCALVAIALFYLQVVHFPEGIYIAAPVLASAVIGIAALSLAGSRFERAGRYTSFAFDAAVVSAALAPILFILRAGLWWRS
jgi:adenylate cyclase